MKKNRWFGRVLILLLALAFVLLSGQTFGKPSALPLPSTALAETREEDFKLLKVGTGGLNVREVQSVLQGLGYYDGNVDGNFSRVLEASVKAFQKDFGLKQTGRVDYDLYALLMEEFSGIPEETQPPTQKKSAAPTPVPVTRDGWYSDKEHVAAYLKAFGALPQNYITKQAAQRLGWVSARGNLWKVAPGKSIGGDRYGNYEGTLPQKKGRQYFECDIDFDGGYRNEKRIIFSNDGLIFYTEDHYRTFEAIN